MAMRSKSFEVKGKLMDFLSSNNNNAKNEKTSGGSKRYRNMAPVFAIDEDDNNPDSEGILKFNDLIYKSFTIVKHLI